MMPQFRFARTLKTADESDEDYQARSAREEAEAREAVMTFILGLVAEPIPLQFVSDPRPERLAEIKGVQVLDKFNCAGCHQLRPGIYDFSTNKSSPVLESLEDLYKKATDPLSKSSEADIYRKDFRFENHNAWVGRPSPSPDRLTAYAIPTQKDADLATFALPPAKDEDNLTIRLVRALHSPRGPRISAT